MLHGSIANEIVMAVGLRAMADAIGEEVGPDVSFALFVDWRDGKPMSYVSDVPRPRVIPILEDWLAKAEHLPGRSGGQLRGAPVLQAKCAELGKQMVEEDIDVALFLIKWGDDGEVAWFLSMDRGQDVVRDWVQSEKRSGS
jgi:hypothetical protein